MSAVRGRATAEIRRDGSRRAATPACPSCGYNEVEMVGAAGTGSFCTWVVVQPALDESSADAVPSTIVVAGAVATKAAR